MNLSPTKKRFDLRQRTPAVVFGGLLVAAMLLGAAVFIVNTQDPVNSDFSFFWFAGYMTRLNHDYYQVPAWIAERQAFGASWNPAPFPYPVPLAIFFTPFSLLPLTMAYVLWVFFSELAILAVLFMGWRVLQVKDASAYLFPALAGIILFRSTLNTLMNGQIAPLLLILLMGAFYCFHRGQWFWGGFCLAFLLLKPNIGVPLVAMLGFWLLLERRWKSLMGGLAAGLLLFAIGMLKDPGWVIEYWQVGGEKVSGVFGYSPTIWGVAAYLCGFTPNCTLVAGAGATVLLMLGYILVVLKIRRHSSQVMLVGGVSVAMTLVSPPYIWSYDHILLIIPLLVIQAELIKQGRPFLLSATVFLFADILAILPVFLAIHLKMDQFSALVPLTVLIALLGLTLAPRQAADSG